MTEEYRANSPESTPTTSSQPNGTRDSLVITPPCPVPLPRPLSNPEKLIWERYRILADDEYYGYALGLVAEWKGHLPATLEILEAIAELAQPIDVEGKIRALVHAMRRSCDDLGIILGLANDMLPYDTRLLRRIEKERGVVLAAPIMTDAPQRSADQETLQ
jgi:hypothetical protein